MSSKPLITIRKESSVSEGFFREKQKDKYFIQRLFVVYRMGFPNELLSNYVSETCLNYHDCSPPLHVSLTVVVLRQW